MDETRPLLETVYRIMEETRPLPATVALWKEIARSEQRWQGGMEWVEALSWVLTRVAQGQRVSEETRAAIWLLACEA